MDLEVVLQPIVDLQKTKIATNIKWQPIRRGITTNAKGRPSSHSTMNDLQATDLLPDDLTSTLSRQKDV